MPQIFTHHLLSQIFSMKFIRTTAPKNQKLKRNKKKTEKKTSCGNKILFNIHNLPKNAYTWLWLWPGIIYRKKMHLLLLLSRKQIYWIWNEHVWLNIKNRKILLLLLLLLPPSHPSYHVCSTKQRRKGRGCKLQKKFNAT